jgi:hypothetical protein
VNLYILIGLGIAGAVAFGLVVWNQKWLFKLGWNKGAVDQKLVNAEGDVKAEEEARELERDISETMVQRPDTSDTRKKLQDGDF